MNLMLGPYVNLNGTSQPALSMQAHDVYQAAHKLMTALSNAAPHGRDYQTAPAERCYGHDQQVWEMYRKQVGAIISEYEAMVLRLRKEK